MCPHPILTTTLEVDVIPPPDVNWGSEKLSYLGSYLKEGEEVGLGTRFGGCKVGERGCRQAPGGSLSTTWPPVPSTFYVCSPPPVLHACQAAPGAVGKAFPPRKTRELGPREVQGPALRHPAFG